MKNFTTSNYLRASKVSVSIKKDDIQVMFYDKDNALVLDYYTKAGDAFWFSELQQKLRYMTNNSYAHYILEYICGKV